MGRLRNLSQSWKAAAFGGDANGNASAAAAAANDSHSQTTDDSPKTKDISSVIRETSSLSVNESPSTSRRFRSNSRPGPQPLAQIYEPPTMGVANSEQIQELQPVFGFLSSHQNKLYQEGYFLKLNDLDTHGKPNADRNWTECFAQLVGTVLSLWDAASLDTAGQDGEVAPTFINLADASIKMIETLPTRNTDVQPLQNVLSVSTAGKNRYLLHFNSLHSLTQWTAGIRLSMFENASLQEVYTGSLIAGKGKYLNNIRTIMERSKFREEDWCRVRFGAGTPWRRCWYVIEPPDEKEWHKANKSLKKRGAYDKPTVPKGHLKFYDNRKTKKATPIATISEVYSAYAVYPQSKPLIEQSTLVKLEGRITIHSKPESITEGFVFVMPEVHPAVSGFEMLLRFLFPVYDTFSLYGRPSRLIADTLDSRGLMFAMPKDKRYGYLDIIDVAGLIHTNGSDKWNEREWRKQLKELIARRMSMSATGRISNVETSSRRSLGSRPGGIRFGDDSTLSVDQINQSTDAVFQAPKKTFTSPASTQSLPMARGHNRSISESVSAQSPSKRRLQKEYIPSRLAVDQEVDEEAVIQPLPVPPVHRGPRNGFVTDNDAMQSGNSSDSELQPRVDPEELTQDLPVSVYQQPPTPVAPPMFQHQANDQPTRRPRDRPDLRREKSRMSSATLSQLVDASKNSEGAGEAGAAAAAAWKHNGRYDDQGHGVTATSDNERTDANHPDPAMVIDSSQAVRSPSTSSVVRKPLPRTASDHSVTRKQLPVQSRAVPFGEDGMPPSQALWMPVANRNPSPDHSNTKVVKIDKSKKFGVRKTIGDPEFDPEKRNSNIPHVDFGVTQRLDPERTPDSSRPASRTANRSGTPGRISPLPQLNSTPDEARMLPDNQVAYGRASPNPPQARQSGPLWQPVSAPAGYQGQYGLSAEEFVQQRATAARIPQGQVPRRTASSGKIEDVVAPSSSPNRLQKRSNTSRPSSRGSMLDFSGQLSAREQEHVARVTGGPLLNLPERNKTPDPTIGLIGAIETREHDKRVAREGVSSQVAQAEFARRQQQAYLQQMHAQNVQRGNAFAQPQGQWLQQQQYYQPNQYPPSQQRPQFQQYPTQQQQQYPTQQQQQQYPTQQQQQQYPTQQQQQQQQYPTQQQQQQQQYGFQPQQQQYSQQQYHHQELNHYPSQRGPDRRL